MRSILTPNEAVTDRFSSILVFLNPKSTHAAAARRRIKEIERLMPGTPIAVIETEAGGRAANERLVRKHANKLGPNTLLCIAAGDGTTSQIIEAVLTSKGLSGKARKTVIFPIWGGNANDLAHMLNGPAYKAKLADILKNGRIVPIHPLQCDMTGKDQKSHTRLAACYASLGVSGFVAKRLTQPEYRQNPLHKIPGGTTFMDILAVISSIMGAPSFSIKEHGDVRSIYELSFHNGSRMAKIERLPAKLTDEMFYLKQFESKKLLSVIPRMLEVTRKGISQNLLRNYTSFTTQAETLAQFDGEPELIQAHTKVQVQLSPRPFYALATILKNEDTKK
jgi:diacylglycerol kinase family enzyme